MLLHQLDLTTALRPTLFPNETLLFVQDAVGLYEGKYKLPQYQNGHTYLTSHRACYVDNEEPRKNSVAIELKEVDHPELYPGFLKSSPKVTLIPKPCRHSSLSVRGATEGFSGLPQSGRATPHRQDSPSRGFTPSPVIAPSATWVCPICSFSNPIPSNFDPATAKSYTQLPPCLACGIKPPLVHLVKSAIAAMSNRQIGPSNVQEEGNMPLTSEDTKYARFPCPRCTFENDPSLLNCEICGASLVTAIDRRIGDLSSQISRSDSPGPILKDLNLTEGSLVESIKFSFRAGGEKIFFERLKGALIQRKWLLEGAPSIPKPVSEHEIGSSSTTPNGSTATPSLAPKMVGIAGLERRDQELRKNNEVIIGNAFEDLEALMASVKEVNALAETFRALNNADSNNHSDTANAVLSQSASTLGLMTTKDMLTSDSLYVSELSRNLAEFLTDDTKGILKREGGIMSLVDLWAVFNRLTRGGVELVSPSDFLSAAELWDKLKLPVRLRRFKSGLLVVQGRDRTDEKTVVSLLSWLRQLRDNGPPAGVEVSWDWSKYGKGVTAQETAEKFSWSVGVANEELEMAEEKGALCREQGLDGVRWWENWLVRITERDSPG